ncbi:hypothetical protein [Fodinibius sp.]|uniref:hypothetical protein n=1 Tax=Fodinibius sp. TaxID=1872440 RepID=UPI003562F436
MGFEEMVVALVGAIGGIALVGFIFAKIVGLTKAWINRNNTAITEEDFDRLARAFMEHRKRSERRIQHLEAIIAGEDEIKAPQTLSESSEKPEVSSETIEIDEEQQESSGGDDGNLRNMLHER